jgi:hypothetical protein
VRLSWFGDHCLLVKTREGIQLRYASLCLMQNRTLYRSQIPLVPLQHLRPARVGKSALTVHSCDMGFDFADFYGGGLFRAGIM